MISSDILMWVGSASEVTRNTDLLCSASTGKAAMFGDFGSTKGEMKTRSSRATSTLNWKQQHK